MPRPEAPVCHPLRENLPNGLGCSRRQLLSPLAHQAKWKLAHYVLYSLRELPLYEGTYVCSVS